jgi:divalent metal cation (Fe/Co/Zn/Cd) transporter
LPSVGFGIVFLVLHGLSPATNVLAGRHIPEPPVALYRTFQPAFALIPLALFAGILRYRLWDIERLLNRTTVYAIATALLGGLYAAFIVVAQLLLGTVAASPLIDSKAAVAITTLLFVTAFRPLRDQVQRFIDRRFNRSRYDAQVTMERFAEDLRDVVDPNDIVERLEGVLTEVFEPRHVTLWFREVEAPHVRGPSSNP